MIVPLLVGLALLGSGYRDRYPLPTGVVPDGWGVNIHFTEPKAGEMEAIRAAGFRWVRMDLLWDAVERRKGVYDFREYDALMGHLERVGIRPMFILCYGNALYQDGAPTTREARSAFARFAAAAVARYRGRGVVWEMWNEPNGARFWPPRADASQYVALARETGAAIRRVGPDEWWVGPGVSRFDWAFLEACFEGGLLDDWDAVTIHPYRPTAPETVGLDWARLELLMSRYGPVRPMLSGEWGYSDRQPGIDTAQQARYAVRQYASNLAAGVPMSIWYDWRDDGQDPVEIEHHFGTVAFDRTPKPAYTAIAALSRALEGRRFVRGLPDGRSLYSGEPAWVLELKGEELRSRTATREEAAAARIPWPPSPWRVDGHEAIRRVLSEALVGAGTLAVEVGGRTVRVDRSSLGHAAKTIEAAVGRVETPQRMSVRSEDRPVWEGWVGHASPLHAELVSVGSRQRVLVRVTAPRGTHDETLEVELAIGERVLVQRVPLRNGRADAEFPWYPWESRSTLRARVNGQDVGSTSAPRLPLDLSDSERWVARVQGDASVAAEATVRVERAEAGGPGGDALRLRYSAAKGWRFVEIVDPHPPPLRGEPSEMTAWVFGNASGHALRMRFVDATGQTFQPDYGPIDWKGWRRVRFSLRGDKAGYWGGALDGVVHDPIRITVPVLVDLMGQAGEGSIQVAGVVVAGG